MANPFTYRYPGAKPFTTAEQEVFFGRRQATKELYRLISLEQLVVLYSKSGLGKSSLINAGLVPEIEENNGPKPILVRLNAYRPDTAESPSTKTRGFLAAPHNQPVFLSKVYPDDQSLWYAAKSHMIGNGHHLQLLLIFDQFEELFTYPAGQVEEFAAGLAELISGVVPQRIRSLSDMFLEADPEFLTDRETDLLNARLKVKVLFAIRSDRLSLLDRLSNYLPQIYENRFELSALSAEEAMEAVIKPSQADGKFFSQKFQYTKEAIRHILTHLTDDGNQKVESFQLQIICQYIEQQVVTKGLSKITAEDIGDIEQLYENHYQNQIQRLGDEAEQSTARIFIEEGLIFEEEERRLGVYEGQVYRKFNITPDLLAKLVDTHIVRREASLRGGYIYELSHDTLVAPVLKAKAKRKQQESKLAEEKARMEREKELEAIRQLAEEERRKKEEERRLKEEALLARAEAENARRQAVANAKRIGIYSIVFFILATISIIFLFFGLSQMQKTRKALLAAQASERKAKEFENAFRTTAIASQARKIALSDQTEAYNLAQILLQETHSAEAASVISEISENPQTRFYQTIIDGHLGEIRSVAFTPDGKFLLTAAEDHTAKMWDLLGHEIRSFIGHSGALSSVAVSKDGSQILTGSLDKTAILWSIGGDSLQTFNGHTDRITDVAFHPDSNYVLTGSWDRRAILWNADGNRKVTYYDPARSRHRFGITSVGFSPDGTKVYTGSFDDLVIVWDLSGRKIGEFRGHTLDVLSLDISNDGTKLITGGLDQTIRLWDATSPESASQIFSSTSRGDSYGIPKVVFTADNSFAFSGSWDSRIRYWAIEDLTLKQTLLGHTAGVVTLDVSPDQTYLASGALDGTAKIWHLGGMEFDQKVLRSAQSELISQAAVAPRGDWAVTGDNRGNLRFWKMNGNATPTLIKTHDKAVSHLEISPNGALVLSASADNNIVIRQDDGSMALERPIPFGFAVSACTFSGNSLVFAASGKNGTIKVWDRTGSLRGLINHSLPVQSLALSNDGNKVYAGCDDGIIYRWGIEGNEPVLEKKYAGYPTGVIKMKLSPDDNWLAVVLSADLAVRGIQMHPFDSASYHFFGNHGAEITTIQFSTDEKYLLSGSKDNSLKIWDLEGQFQIQTYLGLDRNILSAGFIRNDTMVMGIDNLGNAKIWNKWLKDNKKVAGLPAYKRAKQGLAYDFETEMLRESSHGKLIRYGDFFAKQFFDFNDPEDLHKATLLYQKALSPPTSFDKNFLKSYLTKKQQIYGSKLGLLDLYSELLNGL